MSVHTTNSFVIVRFLDQYYTLPIQKTMKDGRAPVEGGKFIVSWMDESWANNLFYSLYGKSGNYFQNWWVAGGRHWMPCHPENQTIHKTGNHTAPRSNGRTVRPIGVHFSFEFEKGAVFTRAACSVSAHRTGLCVPETVSLWMCKREGVLGILANSLASAAPPPTEKKSHFYWFFGRTVFAGETGPIPVYDDIQPFRLLQRLLLCHEYHTASILFLYLWLPTTTTTLADGNKHNIMHQHSRMRNHWSTRLVNAFSDMPLGTVLLLRLQSEVFCVKLFWMHWGKILNGRPLEIVHVGCLGGPMRQCPRSGIMEQQ